MIFKSIQKLNVQRTLATGEIVPVGVLAQNRQGVFFQYFDEYISKFVALSLIYLLQTKMITVRPGAFYKAMMVIGN